MDSAHRQKSSHRKPSSSHRTPNPLSGHPLADAESALEPEQIREMEDNEELPDVRDDDPGGDGDLSEIRKPVIEMSAWKKFLFSKWGCAVLLTILIMFILVVFVRPAFFLRRRENTLERPRMNWLVVFITTLVLFLAFAGVPALVVFCKKKWAGKSP